MKSKDQETELERESEEQEAEVERKKGFARFREILGQDFMKLLFSGELALVGLIPFGAGCVAAIVWRSLGLAAIFGAIGGIVAAPQICGILDTALRSLRDEPGFWWMTYKAAWKQNIKSVVAPGAVFGAVISLVVISLYYTDLASASGTTLVLSLLGVLLLTGMLLLVFVQIPLMQLSFFQMLRNALMMFVRLTGRSLLASAVIILYYVLAAAFFPSSLIFLMILNTWFPVLVSLMLLYRDLNTILQIEARRDA